MKKDITGLDDIKLLVDDFYRRVQQDALLAPIFFAHIPGDWEPHLNKMYLFWNAALFGEKGYVGNPFARHAHMPLTKTHFEHWLHWFKETVDAHFDGPMATDAKRRASIMANNFLSRLTAAGANAARVIA